MGKREKFLDDLLVRYPVLASCRDAISQAADMLIECYEHGGKLLVCGNGGSAADASHIVGELMKGFLQKRELTAVLKEKFASVDNERGSNLAMNLQGALPAVSLCSHQSLTSAVSNDMGADFVFAQQVLGYGREGDVLLGISTSGNAENVIYAAVAARAVEVKVIGLTGMTGGILKKYCDGVITVPSDSVPRVQELHLPVYHTLCAMVEEYFFG